MIYLMGRGRPTVFLATLIALAVSSPVRAQSSDAGLAPSDGASAPDGAERFDASGSGAPAEGEYPSPEGAPPVESAPAAAAPSVPSEPPADDADPRALTDFRPALDPYGYWVHDPVYGTVWVPSREVVGENFSPYVTGGRWALAENNQWVWVSEFPFGPIVYHYGRWVYVSGVGWAWIPGYRYAPAWVSFRVPTGAYAYVGWAPLPPDFIWVDGRPVAFYGQPSYYWIFCPSAYVFHSHVHYYVVRDRVLVTRLAYYSRPYHHHHQYYHPHRNTAPRYRVPASPSPQLARVPAKAVPRERVRLEPAAVLPHARAVAGGASPRTPANVTPAPRPSERRPVASPAPRLEGARDAIAPARRPVEPPRVVGEPRPASKAPVPARVEAARPPAQAVAPGARPITPQVRPGAAPSQPPSPAPRVAPSTRTVAPQVRSVAPTPQAAPRTVAPQVRSVAPSRTTSPGSMRSVSPPRTMSPAGSRSRH